ncbi:MAG: hydrogenase small subunit [Chloroflexota bacterium]|nr:hydrogenase small subunit [Chloroflexota bacterium]
MAKTRTAEYPVIWIQCATCTGCSVSVLNSVSPTIKNVLVDEVIPGKHVNVRYQATIMGGQGAAAIEEMEKTAAGNKGGYVLVVEGAIPTAGNGSYGSLGEKNGRPVSQAKRVESLAKDALAVIALGTCAAFGGIAAGDPNPSRCVGVGELLQKTGVKTPLVNVPGCAPHPDWFVGTVARLLIQGLPKPEDLDEYQRPRAFYGTLIHENCPRRAYFDEGKFARKFGEAGCLNELGCKGPVTHADCPLRMWNHGTNWCIGAGSPCIGCCEAGFPDLVAPFYHKMTEAMLPKVGERIREEVKARG